MFFFLNDPPPTEIYPLSLHDALPISQRELLTSALEANLAVLSVRQNETTKRLTTIATIFLPLSFIVGFFGMNFGYIDRTSTRLNSSHLVISYAVFCLVTESNNAAAVH